MYRFKRPSSNEAPEVTTASLPDIVFMLLFFFMTVTVMKDVPLKVKNDLPNATEVKKLAPKDRVIYIYIGRPKHSFFSLLGDKTHIQLNDKIAKVEDIQPFVWERLNEIPEHLHGLVTVSMKVDKKANMGIINDVKEELRKVNMLKISYATFEEEESE